MSVPRIVAAIVDRMPIFRLRATDEQTPGASQTWVQFLVVKPCQVKLNRPRGLLNENRITMTIGRNRKPRPRNATIATLWSRIHRTGRVFTRAPRCWPADVGHDKDQDREHQGERQRRRDRIVVRDEEPALDDVADHLLTWRTQELDVHVVAGSGDEAKESARDDARHRQRPRDLAEGRER